MDCIVCETEVTTFQYVRIKPDAVALGVTPKSVRDQHIVVGITHTPDEMQAAIDGKLTGPVVALWNNPTDHYVEQMAKKGQTYRSIGDFDNAVTKLKTGAPAQIAAGLNRLTGDAASIVAVIVAAGWPVGADEPEQKEA